MKYLKKYESIDESKIGDYVICNDNNLEVGEFIKNNIGQIINISYGIHYYIKYDNIPDDIKKYFNDSMPDVRMMFREEVIHFSENKEKLKLLVTANKYNL